MWNDLLAATALLLVLEGIFPFLSPRRFRETLIQAAGFSDQAMRVMGLGSMIAGLVFLYIIRH